MDVLEVFKTMQYGPAPELSAAANAWLDDHQRKFGLFINNTWKFPGEAGYLASYNPATGEKLADTVQAGQKEVDEAVAAARAGIPELEPNSWTGAGALSLCGGPQPPKTFPAAGGARIDGQWQAHPRIAGYRRAAPGPPLLLPRRLGAADGDRAA